MLLYRASVYIGCHIHTYTHTYSTFYAIAMPETSHMSYAYAYLVSYLTSFEATVMKMSTIFTGTFTLPDLASAPSRPPDLSRTACGRIHLGMRTHACIYV